MKVTAKTHMDKVRAYLDGVDVSGLCFEADDEAGYVMGYRLNDRETFVRSPEGELVIFTKHGNVRIEFIEESEFTEEPS